MPYITPESVRVYTGVLPSWLDLPDEATLDATIADWIEQAQEMATRYLGREWTDEEVPKGVQNGVLRIVANLVAQARIRRQTAILDVNEYRQTLVPDEVFTKSIKADLLPYVDTDDEHGEPGDRGPYDGLKEDATAYAKTVYF